AAGRDEGRKEGTPKRKGREHGMGPEQKGWDALLSRRGCASGLPRQVAGESALDRWYAGTAWTRSSAACSEKPWTQRSRHYGSAGQGGRGGAAYANAR